MKQLEMSLYLKTKVSEIQTQINKLRNFLSTKSITPQKQHHAQTEIQACINRLTRNSNGKENKTGKSNT